MSADAPTDGSDTPWDELSFIVRSKHRSGVLEYLAEHGPAMPRRIADDTDRPMSNVSHELKNLRDRGVVDLLVDDSVQKGRIYGVTDDGHTVYSELKEREML